MTRKKNNFCELKKNAFENPELYLILEFIDPTLDT